LHDADDSSRRDEFRACLLGNLRRSAPRGAARSQVADLVDTRTGARNGLRGGREPTLRGRQPVLLVAHAIDQSGFERGLRVYGFSAEKHAECNLRPYQPRQPLRASRRGIDAQLDFRQSQTRTGNSDSVVAGHRQFQRPADYGPCHRR